MYKKLNESSLSRLWKLAKDHECGTISAWRTYKDDDQTVKYTRDEKNQRHKELRSKLIALGYSVTDIRGVYIENYGSTTKEQILVKEDSLFVADINDEGLLKQDLISLGKEYDQDSITYSDQNKDYYLISTTTRNVHPGYGIFGKELLLGSPMFGKDGEFHSIIKGRPFVFESVNYESTMRLVDFTPTEIRNFKVLKKRLREAVEFDTNAEAYWINPFGKITAVEGSRHISDVIHEPEYFGYKDSDEVRDIFDKYKERYGWDGKAREIIIKNLFSQGWVRIRKNDQYTYTAQCNKLTKKIKDYLQQFASYMISNKVNKSSILQIHTMDGIVQRSLLEISNDVLFNESENKIEFLVLSKLNEDQKRKYYINKDEIIIEKYLENLI